MENRDQIPQLGLQSTLGRLAGEAPLGVTCGVLVAALTFYVLTLAPSVLWGDEAKFQLSAYRLELVADEIDHPLFIALAHAFTWLPFGEIAWRVNLASAVFAALAVAFTFLCGWELTHDRLASLAAASALAVSHTFWAFAVRPQAHALNLLFVAALLWGALRWHGSVKGLCMLGFAFGLGMTNHFLLGFSSFALGWLIYEKARSLHLPILRLAAAGIVSMSLGFAPFLILAAWQESAVHTASSAQAYLAPLISIQTPLRDIALWAGFLSYNFVGIALPLTAIGAFRLWQDQRANWVGVAILYLANAFFVFDLKLPDQYKYFIPSYFALSLAIGPGFVAARHWWQSRGHSSLRFAALMLSVLIAVPLLAYDVTPQVLHAAGISTLLDVRSFPGRDALDFFLQPSKRDEYGANEFAHAALGQAAPNSVLAGDHTLYRPLYFVQQTAALRADVILITLPDTEQAETLEQWARTRPVYLLDVQKYYDMRHIEDVFHVQREGVLYRLTLRTTGG